MNHRKYRYLEIAPRDQFRRGNGIEERGEDQADICPGFSETTIEWAMSRITLKPGLDLLTLEYLLIASCVTLRVVPQLRTHIASALKLGATKEQVVEVIRHMISYAGGPAVTVALNAATEVFQSGKFA